MHVRSGEFDIMHLYLATRGIKHEVDQFITELQGKYLPFKFPNPVTKILEDCYAQLSVRPIQLWEIVFPEGSKDLVLSTIFREGDGKPQHRRHDKFAWGFRKLLNLDPMPETWDKSHKMPIRCEGIETIGLGMKEDYWQTAEGKHVDKKEVGAYEGL